MTKEMIRYRNKTDANTWFIQNKEDTIPSWAVDVEDYVPEDHAPDLGHRCDSCCYGKLEEYGYSAYTVEGNNFSCVRNMHPDGAFDRWYGEDNRLKFANKCKGFQQGNPIRISME